MKKVLCFSLIVFGLACPAWASYQTEVKILTQGPIFVGDSVEAAIAATVPGVPKNVKVCKTTILNNTMIDIYVDLERGPAREVKRRIPLEAAYPGLNAVSVTVYYTDRCSSIPLPQVSGMDLVTFKVEQPAVTLPWWWIYMY